eukprot:4976921-Pleurochrysis_carterae.AAC.1
MLRTAPRRYKLAPQPGREACNMPHTYPPSATCLVAPPRCRTRRHTLTRTEDRAQQTSEQKPK